MRGVWNTIVARLGMRWLIAGALAVVLAGVLVLRPEARQALPIRPPAATSPPALSNENKLQFQSILKDLEIAKLKYEAAQRDFADAQRAAAALVEKTRVPGYDLDLQSFQYTPLAAVKK